MIEKRIRNELTLKRYRRFKSKTSSVLALWFIVVITFFSVTAEFWANNKPIVMRHKGKIYFPVVIQYPSSEFEQQDTIIPNYREITPDGWAIWPIVKWDPYETNSAVEQFPSGPSSDNWLGTDDRGRDIFTRLLYGYRYSVSYGVAVWLLSFLIGTVLGGIMGYAGGNIDLLGQRLVEVFSTVPQFFLLIIIISIFQPSLWMLIAISAVFGWIMISYYIRAEFLKLRKREFVEAARALGSSHSRLLFKHLLPNSMGPIITFSPFVIAGNIAALASLDFLGFGLPPPTPSWGELLAQAQKYFTVAWWLAVYPSLALFFTLVLFGLVGEGVRDAYDPKKTK
jgi:microcin C transport system permease protein